MAHFYGHLMLYFWIVFRTGNAAKPKHYKDVEISIVGAGIAGLSAADKLINSYGFEKVKIFEAKDRIGGRIYPYKYGDVSLQIGAEYVHGTVGNPMYELAKELGALETNPREGFGIVPQCNDSMFDWSVKEKFDLWTEKFWDKLEDSEMGSCAESVMKEFDKLMAEDTTLTPQEKNAMKILIEAYKSETQLEYGSPSWDQMSVRQWSHYAHYEGDPAAVMNTQGYQQILEHFQKRLPDGVINLNSTVEVIDWSQPNSVTLKFGGGETVTSDHVIVTTSLGYLKKHAASMFEPALPDYKRKVIDAMGFGVMERMYLEFEASDYSFSAGEHLCSTWYSDPHILGAYSYYSVASEYSKSPQLELAKPLRAQNSYNILVQFAGEATHEDKWQTTHGAMLTGWREAERLEQIYVKNAKETQQTDKPPNSGSENQILYLIYTVIAAQIVLFY